MSISNRSIDVAVGHRTHHREPDTREQVLLGTRYATADGGALVVVVGCAGAGIAALVGANRSQVAATSAAAGIAALGFYEWIHLLVHTGYRPKTAWLRGLKSHHRLHHFRDDTKWLGVTSTLADRVLGTLDPAPPSAA